MQICKQHGKNVLLSLREMSGLILFLLEQTRQKESENIRKDIIFRRKNVLRAETNIMIKRCLKR